MQGDSLSLFVGNTPLIKAIRMPFLFSANVDIYFKHEGRNPTGTIHDRGVSAVARKMMTSGYPDGMISYSDGTDILSLVSFMSRCGMKSFIFVSESDYKHDKFLDCVGFDTKIIVVKDTEENTKKIVKRLADEYPFFFFDKYSNSDYFDAIKEVYNEINEKIGHPDFVVVNIENLSQLSFCKKMAEETKVETIFATRVKEVSDKASEVMLVNVNEIQEADNFLKRHEGMVTDIKMAVAAAAVIRCDQLLRFKDEQKIVILIESMGIKSFHQKDVLELMVRIEPDFEIVKKIMGLK